MKEKRGSKAAEKNDETVNEECGVFGFDSHQHGSFEFRVCIRKYYDDWLCAAYVEQKDTGEEVKIVLFLGEPDYENAIRRRNAIFYALIEAIKTVDFNGTPENFVALMRKADDAANNA